MTNQDTRTLKLTRRQVCDIRRALTGVIISFQRELDEEGIDEDRKEIAQRSLAMWEALKAEVVKQLDEQDA